MIYGMEKELRARLRRELRRNNTDVLGERDVLPAIEDASRERDSSGGVGGGRKNAEVDLLASEDQTVARIVSEINLTIDNGIFSSSVRSRGDDMRLADGSIANKTRDRLRGNSDTT